LFTQSLQAQYDTVQTQLSAEQDRSQKAEQLTQSLQTRLSTETERALKAEELVAALEKRMTKELAKSDKLSMQREDLEAEQVSALL